MENKAINKIILIADTFFPEKNSAALMLRSLAKHIHNDGVELIIVTPHDDPKKKLKYKEKGVIFSLSSIVNI